MPIKRDKEGVIIEITLTDDEEEELDEEAAAKKKKEEEDKLKEVAWIKKSLSMIMSYSWLFSVERKRGFYGDDPRNDCVCHNHDNGSGDGGFKTLYVSWGKDWRVSTAATKGHILLPNCTF